MEIRRADATFGKLHSASLVLAPGLNILTAPNEGGKSTWSRFFLSMFYGINTRQRGALADKNRFLPWDGTPMQGKLELTCGEQAVTLRRSTSKSDAPLGDFSCTYTGTDVSLPAIDALCCGEMLIGVPQSVYQRCGFISAGALAVDGDAELERRIAALIATGEEHTAYSAVQQTLKKQLHQRQYNKSGTIPRLQAEIDTLQADRSTAQLLTRQQEETAQRLALRQQQVAEARQQDVLQADRLQKQWDTLPDGSRLRALEERLALSRALAEQAQQAQDACARQEEELRHLEQEAAENPLYPLGMQELEAQLQYTPAPVPSLAQLAIPFALGLCGGGVLWYCLESSAPPAITGICGAWVAAAAAFFLARIIRRAKRRRAYRKEKERQEGLCRLAEDYLPLLAQLEESRSALAQRQRAAQDSEAQLRSQLAQLMQQAQALDSSLTTPKDVRQFARRIAQQRESLAAEMRRSQSALLSRQAEPEDDTAVLQQRLAALQAQLTALGSEQELTRLMEQKQLQLSQQQEEYDALTLALEALQGANDTLQTRFSPELGRRAAAIFTEMTGARWSQITLDRDFHLAVESDADTTRRDAQLLSAGTIDQLYLATRLAICDLLLPEETNPPLILDDALLTFDDERLHKTLEYLLKLGQRRQILLFTCQGREADYLAGREGAHIVSLF